MNKPELTLPGLHGAFVKDGYRLGPAIPRTSDQLEGVRLAVKDVFDIAASRTGAGNPAWWQDQPAADKSADAVSVLLAAGATWVGKTVTDELAYSLTGANVHYGTPVNPADARRLPGGSSSGSAVAVAGGHADIGLATDCGGSARLPASYCGVWGIRPSHGHAGKSGFTLAPSFDTVGWFTRTGEAMMDVLNILVPGLEAREPRVWLVSEDALAACDPQVRSAMFKMLDKSALPVKRLALGTLPLADWAEAYRVLAGAEIWQEHGQWVMQNKASLAGDVLDRFMAASRITTEQVSVQRAVRSTAIEILADLLENDAVLLSPSAPGPAPLCTTAEHTLSEERHRIQKLVSAAGLAGLPQLSVPWIEIDGGPVGLAVMGSRANDASVVHAALLLEKAVSSV